MKNIKEKVLKEKVLLMPNPKYSNEINSFIEEANNIIQTITIPKTIDITLAMRNKEVGKVIDDYKKDMKVLKGDTELTFEEHIDNIKQKLGIK